MCPNFAKGSGVAFFPAGLEKIGDDLYEEHVMVVARGRRDTWIIIVEADRLKAREGVCEDS